MGRLDGRVALVTGASRGIGEAIAVTLAAEGARVVCAARTLREGDARLPGSLETTVATIRSAGGEAVAITADISGEAECLRLVAEAQTAYGPVDILINNAGITFRGKVADLTAKRWQLCFAVNVHAPFYLSRAVLPAMTARRSGAIVSISSAGAMGPGRGPYTKPLRFDSALYGATKAALERFTQGLAGEVTDDSVAVTCVSPSQAVRTPGFLLQFPERRDDPDLEPPSMMANAVLLLASAPAAQVNGRVCYSQQILLEHGWISEGRGWGITIPTAGYSAM